MKILQVVQSLDARTGGVARAVLLLSEALAKAGHEIEIATLDAPGAGEIEATSLPVHRLGTGRGGYGYAPDLLPWLRTHGAKFDCAIVNGMWQYGGFATWRRYAGSNIPYYVFPHGMLDPWFKRTYPLKHLKKWLYWPWAEYRILRDARAVIFTSAEERRAARESFWLYRAREEVCPLGIQTPLAHSAEEFLARFPALRGKRIILFLGRLHPKKGCDLLINAFAAVSPDAALVMAGPDQWRGELQRRAASLGKVVLFPGMLDGPIKWSALRAAEVFILPSHQENFALAVTEALACGLPVLISNKVNIWREVVEDHAGLIENDDEAGTKRLLTGWLAMTPAERETMGANARRCFARRFEIHRAAEALLRILQ